MLHYLALFLPALAAEMDRPKTYYGINFIYNSNRPRTVDEWKGKSSAKEMYNLINGAKFIKNGLLCCFLILCSCVGFISEIRII